MIEDGQTLFDIVLKAIDYTLINTGKMFVLWDNFGKLTLTDVETAKLDLFVGDGSLATGFTYESEIEDVYKRQNSTSGYSFATRWQVSRNLPSVVLMILALVTQETRFLPVLRA